MARTELRLSPLSQRASEQLIASVLQVTDDERKSIAARAAGNPLFLEELVRARAVGMHELPQAVHAVLQARLDALGGEARRLAQAASVFGQTFWAEGVASLRTVPDVTAPLAELVRAEVVVPRNVSRFAQTTEFLFRHALVRDAAYAMLIDGERRDLHARAAAWLEKVGEIDPAVVGQHYASGGRPAQAVAHFVRAAATALAESAFEEAERYATRALDAGPDGDVAIEALLLRAEARRALGRSDAMLEDARAARSRAETDPALQIRALSTMAEALHLVGDLDAADATLRAVLEESHASLLSSRIQALLQLALVDLDAGRGTEANTLIDEALSWLPDGGDVFSSERLRALTARIAAHAAVAEYSAAVNAARHAIDAAVKAGHRTRIAEARIAGGRLFVQLGRAAEVRADIERVCSEATGLRVPHLEATAHNVLGMALAATGDLDGAIAAQLQSIAVGKRIQAKYLVLVAETWRAIHLLDRGQPGDAAVVLARIDDLLEQAVANAPLKCVLEAVSVRALITHGLDERALEASERANAALKQLGHLDAFEEYVRLSHALALDAMGKTREAETALYQARERLQRKASKLAAAERDAFLQGVPSHRAVIDLARARVDKK
jgi:tetratricopeptide (TPR) repeat protein